MGPGGVQDFLRPFPGGLSHRTGHRVEDAVGGSLLPQVHEPQVGVLREFQDGGLHHPEHEEEALEAVHEAEVSQRDSSLLSAGLPVVDRGSPPWRTFGGVVGPAVTGVGIEVNW